MRWLREAELKHGRVCMLATVGFAAQQFITLPGEKPTPDALQAVYTASPAALATLLFLAGWIESSSYGGKITMLDMFEEDREPGNLGFGTRFIAGKSAEETKDLRLKELNNGRLAMMAFSGMVHHNLVVSGPLFPLFPEGWAGPQYTWQIDSVMGGLQNQPVPP
uniref:Light harvesting protein n=1 Tax=Alexandrium monilatum TaxID=311494 RepID=A0A7S4SQP4_9DINO